MSELAEYINEHFGGTLKFGSHEPNGEACALEALSQFKGLNWSDQPNYMRCFDFRPLNDAAWSSDAKRTAAIVPLMEALDGSLDWPHHQRQAFVQLLAIETVRRIIADLPIFLVVERERCRRAETLSAAADAAEAARRVAAATDNPAYYADNPAYFAAHAAYYAAQTAQDVRSDFTRSVAAASADAANCTARADTYHDKVLERTCAIWIQAAKDSRDPKLIS